MLRKLIVLMVGLALLGGFEVANANGKKGTLEVRVRADFGTFDTAVAAPVGGAAFYVGGDICEELDLLNPDCTPIGKFHCWGWLIGPDQAAGPVSQEYILFDRGKIQVQGFEDEGPRAVVGGTGHFRNVRGQATGFDLSEFMATGEFSGTFKLIGAKRNKKEDDDD